MSGNKVDTRTGRMGFPTGLYYPRLGFRGIICVIAASMVSVALIPSAGCSGGEEDKIAFVSDRDGDPEIYIMDTDGSNQIPLTNNGALDGQPRWSPDKKWIAFISDESGDREINLVEVGQEEPTIKRLTNSPGTDSMHSWSPDGKRIAFVSNRDGRPEIYLMDISGARFSRVTSGRLIPASADRLVTRWGVGRVHNRRSRGRTRYRYPQPGRREQEAPYQCNGR